MSDIPHEENQKYCSKIVQTDWSCLKDDFIAANKEKEIQERHQCNDSSKKLRKNNKEKFDKNFKQSKKEIKDNFVKTSKSLNDLLSDNKKSKDKVKKYRSNIQDMSIIKKLMFPSFKTTPEILQYHTEKSSIKLQSLIELTNKVIASSDKVCQFCNNFLVEVTQEQTVVMENSLNKLNFAKIYCCAEYEYFVSLLHIATKDTGITYDELLDITHRNTSINSQKHHTLNRYKKFDFKINQSDSFQDEDFLGGRQIKTIQYSVSSPKCMDEGWTIKPSTSITSSIEINDEIKIDLDYIKESSTIFKENLFINEKFYENGEKFMTIFPDGSGCCYYPNGEVAVMILSTEKHQSTFIIFQKKRNSNHSSQILAIFESNGNSICHYSDEHKIRLFVNSRGGIELKRNGEKYSRWQWYLVQGHKRTPPFHPMCFSLNKYISVRYQDQYNIGLLLSINKQNIRFNVAAKIKNCKGNRFEPDESEYFLKVKKRQIASIFAKIHKVLKLPQSTRWERPQLSNKRNRHLKEMGVNISFSKLIL
ncbi:glutamate-rich protein 6 isoform X1 [Hydra vulgaris]|uniref:glutamate-rich protein 6 isoform X1 n=1 Tax=Hydra vulgaris TaxID=6087 RepID=UPI0032EA3F74